MTPKSAVLAKDGGYLRTDAELDLFDDKYTLLGGGVFGSVWTTSRPHLVRKVAGDCRYDSYVDWLMESKAHRDLRIVPKICSRITVGPHNYVPLKVYKMERLTPLPKLYSDRFSARGTKYSWDDVCSALERAVYMARSGTYRLNEVLSEYVDEQRVLRTVLRANELRDFKRLLTAVYEGDVMHNACIDIHAGNVCLRDDGSIVIIDPLS